MRCDFVIEGVPFTVTSNSALLLDHLQGWLRPFLAATPWTCPNPGGVKVWVTDLGDGPAPPATRAPSTGTLEVELPDLGRVLLSRKDDTAWVYVRVARALQQHWPLEDLINPAFELLRARGVYLWHAGGVGMGNTVILVAGKSGAGKSTLVQDLVSRGFDFVSDDRCFVSRSDGFFRLAGTSEHARVFPANMEGVIAQALVPGPGGKATLNMKELYPDRVATGGTIGLVLFARWAPLEATRMEALSATEALKCLLPLNLECYFEDTSRSQFYANCQLVEEIPSFLLHLGADRGRWSQLVVEAWEQGKGVTG